MKVLETYQWREKVTPVLLKKYDEAVARRDQPVQKIILEYYGNFDELSLDLEVLSALDHWLQVRISLSELPTLASVKRIKRIELPGYFS